MCTKEFCRENTTALMANRVERCKWLLRPSRVSANKGQHTCMTLLSSNSLPLWILVHTYTHKQTHDTPALIVPRPISPHGAAIWHPSDNTCKRQGGLVGLHWGYTHPWLYSHVHTHTHTHTHTCTYTHTLSHTHTHKQTNITQDTHVHTHTYYTHTLCTQIQRGCTES